MDTKQFVYHIKYCYPNLVDVYVKNGDYIVAQMNFGFKGNKCNLFVIHVEDQYRRLGISSKMLQILENECYNENVNVIEGRYWPENENAQYMYEKNGYSIYEDGNEKYIVKVGISTYDVSDLDIVMHNEDLKALDV